DQTLAMALRSGDRMRIYQTAIDQLARLRAHAERNPDPGCGAWSRTFDYDLYQWEFEHFIEYGLLGRGARPTGAELKTLRTRFDAISKELAAAPRSFTHRDYQSRNIMVLPTGEQVVIDFQDALQGPRQYDLVALLRDSYVELDRPLIDKMLKRYLARLVEEGGPKLDQRCRCETPVLFARPRAVVAHAHLGLGDDLHARRLARGELELEVDRAGAARRRLAARLHHAVEGLRPPMQLDENGLAGLRGRLASVLLAGVELAVHPLALVLEAVGEVLVAGVDPDARQILAAEARSGDWLLARGGGDESCQENAPHRSAPRRSELARSGSDQSASTTSAPWTERSCTDQRPVATPQAGRPASCAARMSR